MAFLQFRCRHRLIGALAALLAFEPMRAVAQSASEIEQLRLDIEALRRGDQEKQRKLDALEREVNKLRGEAGKPKAAEAEKPELAEEKKAALERAIEEGGGSQAAPPRDVASGPLGAGRIRLIDVSLDVIAAGGTSTATEDEIRRLQGGGHDPNRRGFTLQQAELSLTGAVDPYLSGEAHIIYVPGGVELEEAFLTTESLPYGLQLEAGHFFTEFGRVNPTHPHAWDWIDQPVINSRFFGGDGLRAPGFRLGWLTPLPWFSEFHAGAQNANEGETTASFIGEKGIGGRPSVYTDVRNPGDLLYLARWNNAWNLAGDATLLFGVSGLHGPNGTGAGGQTWIYGGDFKLRWRPEDNFRGWPFFVWQSEVMKRDYTADWFVAGQETGEPGGHSHGDEEEPEEEAPEEDIPGRTLRDWGLYTQVLYGFRYGWAGGLRFDYAGGREDSVGGRQSDPLRGDRYRLSPLLVWRPTEYARFRLQYNYDMAKHLEDDEAHSVWLGAEVLYGVHPAHQY